MVTVLNVALENHPGSLAEILGILARAEINIEAVEAEAQGDFGTLRILTPKSKFAADLLRQDGYDVIESDVIELQIPNQHGELARLAKRLADNGVNVVSLFGTAPQGGGSGRVLLRVGDTKKARQVLGVP